MALSGWKRDVRMGVLALVVLMLSVVPWLCFGAVSMAGRGGRTVAVSADGMPPCVAITFDDGPRRTTTAALLDGLAQRGVHATFFLIGLHVDGNEELILRMEAEGHQVGIHSQNHRILTGLNSEDVYREVGALQERLTALTGQTDFMVRPPYGEVDDTLRSRIEAPIILWSVDPRDWEDEDVARQTAAIVEAAQDGDIILLHDIYPSSVDTALQAVDGLMARGFRLVTVEELFHLRGIDPQNGKVYRRLPS